MKLSFFALFFLVMCCSVCTPKTAFSKAAYTLIPLDFDAGAAYGSANNPHFPLFEMPTIRVAITNAICGKNNGSIKVIANGLPPFVFALNGGSYQNADLFTGLAAGSYTVLVQDASGGTATATVEVSDAPAPLFKVEASPTKCSNITGRIVVSSTEGSGPFEYRLNTAAFQQDSVFSKLGLGVYTVSVKDSNGCVTTQQVYVNLNDDLKTDGPDSLVLCEGRSATIPITSNAEGFFWSPTEGLLDPLALSPVVSPVNDAVYTITSRMGICTTRGSVRIIVYPQPVVNAGPDQRIVKGTTTTLQGSINDSLFTIRWSPTVGLNNAGVLQPSLTPRQSQVYTLTATGKGNCTARDSVLIEVFTPLLVPNIFSPNQDGINDTWLIQNLADYPNARLWVFDRYGQLVYSSAAANGWDGTSNGKPVAVGTYYYVIDLGDGGMGKMAGGITVVR